MSSFAQLLQQREDQVAHKVQRLMDENKKLQERVEELEKGQLEKKHVVELSRTVGELREFVLGRLKEDSAFQQDIRQKVEKVVEEVRFEMDESSAKLTEELKGHVEENDRLLNEERARLKQDYDVANETMTVEFSKLKESNDEFRAAMSEDSKKFDEERVRAQEAVAELIEHATKADENLKDFLQQREESFDEVLNRYKQELESVSAAVSEYEIKGSQIDTHVAKSVNEAIDGVSGKFSSIADERLEMLRKDASVVESKLIDQVNSRESRFNEFWDGSRKALETGLVEQQRKYDAALEEKLKEVVVESEKHEEKRRAAFDLPEKRVENMVAELQGASEMLEKVVLRQNEELLSARRGGCSCETRVDHVEEKLKELETLAAEAKFKPAVAYFSIPSQTDPVEIGAGGGVGAMLEPGTASSVPRGLVTAPHNGGVSPSPVAEQMESGPATTRTRSDSTPMDTTSTSISAQHRRTDESMMSPGASPADPRVSPIAAETYVSSVPRDESQPTTLQRLEASLHADLQMADSEAEAAREWRRGHIATIRRRHPELKNASDEEVFLKGAEIHLQEARAQLPKVRSGIEVHEAELESVHVTLHQIQTRFHEISDKERIITAKLRSKYDDVSAATELRAVLQEIANVKDVVLEKEKRLLDERNILWRKIADLKETEKQYADIVSQMDG